MADSQDFLVARGLRKAFGPFQAVDSVSFTITRKEIFGLLGPNGAGKTTVIRIMSTVLKPDDGHVSIGGLSVTGDSDSVRKLIGVCPQELALYPELSAIDNLVFFGRMAGLGGRQARRVGAKRISNALGFKDRARDRGGTAFSGGMKRRDQHCNRADEPAAAPVP